MIDVGGPADRSPAERQLDTAVSPILPSGIRFACRAIRQGDRALLLPDEAASISYGKDHMRDATGAVRHVARGLLEQAGLGGVPIRKSEDGAPVWPAGVVGSLAHDDEFAIAVIAAATSLAGLGVDIEPAAPLPAEVADLVKTDGDILDGIDESLASRLLFAAKEAVYKAVYPRDQIVLGFEDVFVDLSKARARTVAGRRIELAWSLRPRIVVVAFDRA